MSRFIPHPDMTPAQIIQCSYDATAIIELCRCVADNVSGRDHASAVIIGYIGTALRLANDLLAPVHDYVEHHEALTSAEKSTG